MYERECSRVFKNLTVVSAESVQMIIIKVLCNMALYVGCTTYSSEYVSLSAYDRVLLPY